MTTIDYVAALIADLAALALSWLDLGVQIGGGL